MTGVQRWTSWCNDPKREDPNGKWVTYADHLAAVTEAVARGREEQRASDYVTLWSRLMLEERKYRAALARAAFVIRQRLTRDDVFRLTGTLVDLHEWETVKPVPDAYEQGAADERARIRAAVLGLETHWRWPKHRLGLDRLDVLGVIDGGAE